VTVERLLPTAEARELIQLAADVADKVLDPIVDSGWPTWPPRSFRPAVAKLVATDAG
jgi:hypothetical protein